MDLSLFQFMAGGSHMGNLNFDKNLLEAVDCGLLSLGENPRKAIYFHMKRSFQLQRESIPKETDEFSRALNTIFGPGAEIIEKYILKELYQRLELSFEEKEGFTFVDYVREAEKLVVRKNRAHVRTRT